ncbi:MAG TPA: MarR family transcriptional regulator [Rhizomicrobium sp.]|jgi:DNA-binding MarR family transcriptional regulator|nr:MarR family transcriptional regulator [Rhizomicrobium sp.]
MSRPVNWRRENDPSAHSTLPPDGAGAHDGADCCLFEPVGTPDSLDLLFLVQTVARNIRKQWEKELRARIPGLNATRASAILELGRSGGASQSQLAILLGLSRMAMSQLLDDLESRDWILRESVPADRRTWAIRLTEEGQRALSVFQAIGRSFADRSCAAISDKRRIALAQTLFALANGAAAVSAAEAPQNNSSNEQRSEQ